MAKRQRRRREERRRRHASRSGLTLRTSVLTGAGLTAGAVLGTGGVANAADFTVTNLSDGPSPGPAGSLRKAITDANANPGLDNVVFDSSLSGAVYLAYGALEITQELTVQGPGAGTLRIDGYFNYSRLITVDPDVAGDPVTISGLSLAYGFAGRGGAISNLGSKLTVADDLIYANAADSPGIGGGAVYDSGEYASGAETLILNSTIVGNVATNGAGGGIGSSAQLGTIRNSTIAGNTAATNGGGLLSANGGTLQDSTVAGNYAYGSGGGIDESGSGTPHVTLENSLVGDNAAGTGGQDLFGTVQFDAQFSLLENTSGVTVNPTVANSNITGADAALPSYLSFTGGPTPTLLPAYNSPVIDQGLTAGGVSTDQRGLPRPFDLPSFTNSTAAGADGADMGAVEMTTNETTPADLNVSVTDSPDPVTVGDPLNYAFHVQNNGPEDATGVVLTELIPTHVSLSTLSGDCAVTGTDPLYGTYIDCDLGDLASGGSSTRNFTVTPQSDAASAPYITAYAAVSGDQADPNTYNNFSYTDTVVQKPPSPQQPPTVTPPPPGKSNVAAAVKRCKKKFRHNAKKRKKCIKRARGRAASSVERRWTTAQPVHPFTERPRPRGIRPLALNSRLNRLNDGR